MELEFTDAVFEWRGPAPYHFVRVPVDEALVIQDVAAAITYGWGMIPVAVTIGATTWTTSLWPKEGCYVVPVKDAIRAAEGISLHDVVTVRLRIESNLAISWAGFAGAALISLPGGSTPAGGPGRADPY